MVLGWNKGFASAASSDCSSQLTPGGAREAPHDTPYVSKASSQWLRPAKWLFCWWWCNRRKRPSFPQAESKGLAARKSPGFIQQLRLSDLSVVWEHRAPGGRPAMEWGNAGISFLCRRGGLCGWFIASWGKDAECYLLLLSNRLTYYVSVFQRCLPLEKQLSLRKKKTLPEQQNSPTPQPCQYRGVRGQQKYLQWHKKHVLSLARKHAEGHSTLLFLWNGL